MTWVAIAIEAEQLTLWGVALLLCWVSTLRLWNVAHIAAAARGWVRAPHHVMQPMGRWTDWCVPLVGLAAGNAALIAFAGSAVDALHIPPWMVPGGLAPWLQLVRGACALVVLLYFLTRVAENPRYKLIWAACWCVFSLAVVILA